VTHNEYRFASTGFTSLILRITFSGALWKAVSCPDVRAYDTIPFMNHNDHVNLLKPANLPSGGAWADFGAGRGAFTLALRELTGPTSDIFAIDKDNGCLNGLERDYRIRFGDPNNLHIIPGDFTGPLDLPVLDGAVMANSLHYFKNPKMDVIEGGSGRENDKNIRAYQHETMSHSPDKMVVMRHIRSYLKPRGLLLLIEYNVDSGNPWVPYPVSFETWRELALHAGFNEPRLLAKRSSSFLNEFYSAVVNKIGN
jgi:SAM-dependent methyltransferase